MSIPIINNLSELNEKLAEIKKAKSTTPESVEIPAKIGFVPTMGALHAGHKSLIEKSSSENAVTVVSIFLNPMQFAESEDFDIYPSTIKADSILCESAGADIIFCPQTNLMYPKGFISYVDMTEMTNVMCGKSRPRHFKGVLTVVCKLLNIVRPDRAYFGEKDAQQLAVIKRMVIDLNMQVEIIACPTIREEDGLAMSTRNTYLNSEERKAATCLYKALNLAEELIIDGKTFSSDIESAKKELERIISAEPLAEIEYIEILDADTFANITESTTEIICALAVKFGNTRLIDNKILRL